jgi:hypothetical protein
MPPASWARLRERLPARIPRQPWVVLLPLMLVQWLFLLLRVRSVEHNGWLFYEDPGETHLYSTAWSLAHGHIPPASIGYGWSLLTAPIAGIAGVSLLNALPALVLFQTLVLLPVALFAVYGIASRIGGRLLGYFTAAGWVVAPYLAIPLFVPDYHQRYVDQVLPQGLGLTGLSDFPSMVCVLVAAYFAVAGIDSADPVHAALGGLFAAFAIAIDPSNVAFLAAPVVGYTLARRPRGALAFGLALLPPLIALALWKYRGLGHVPLHAVHADLHHMEQLRVDFSDVFYSDRLIEVPFIAGVIALARRSWAKSAFVAAWFLALLLVKGSAPESSVDTGSVFPLIMPALPAFVIACCSLPLLVPRFGPRLADALAAHGSPRLRWRDRRVVAAWIVLAAAPLIVFAALPVQNKPTIVAYAADEVLVPIDKSFQLQATVRPGTVGLRWPARKPPGTAVFYDVFGSRANAGGGISCDAKRGATNCALRMRLLATTSLPVFDVIGLTPGRWTYRVGIAANAAGGTTGGDMMVLSQLIDVTPP